jgi:hypothetical protein
MELEGIEEEGMLPDWLAGEDEEDLDDLEEFDWEEESFDATGWLQSEEQALQVGEEAGEVDVAEVEEDLGAAPGPSPAEEGVEMPAEDWHDLEIEAEPVPGDEELFEPQTDAIEEMEAEQALEVTEEPVSEEALAEVEEPVTEEEAMVVEEPAVAGEAEALRSYQERLASGEDVPSLIEDLQQATQRYESEPRFLQLLGDAYNKNGQLKMALDAYRQALEKL